MPLFVIKIEHACEKAEGDCSARTFGRPRSGCIAATVGAARTRDLNRADLARRSSDAAWHDPLARRLSAKGDAIPGRLSRALFPFRDSQRSPEHSLGNLLSHTSSFSSALHRLEKVNPRETSCRMGVLLFPRTNAAGIILFIILLKYRSVSPTRNVSAFSLPSPSGANSLLFQIRGSS